LTLTYVVNAPPEFNPDYPQTNGGGAAVDVADPKQIAITYAVRDPDTASGSPANQYKIWPSFEYSLNNGNSWQTIDAGYLEDGDLESAERRQTLRIRWKRSSAKRNLPRGLLIYQIKKKLICERRL